MKKGFSTLVIILAFVVGLFGCSKRSEPSNNPSAPSEPLNLPTDPNDPLPPLDSIDNRDANELFDGEVGSNVGDANPDGFNPAEVVVEEVDDPAAPDVVYPDEPIAPDVELEPDSPGETDFDALGEEVENLINH